MKANQNDRRWMERARVAGFRVVVRAPARCEAGEAPGRANPTVKVATSIFLRIAAAVSCAFGVLSGIWFEGRTTPPPAPQLHFRTTDLMPDRIEVPAPPKAQVVMLL